MFFARLLQLALISMLFFLCITCDTIDAPTQAEIKQFVQKYSLSLHFREDSVSNHFLNNKLVYDSLFGDKRIIGLGESTHGTHESSVINCEIIKYLVQYKNCKAICMEGYYFHSVVANDYILNRIPHNDPSIVQAGCVKPVQPFKELLEWLRQYNKSTLHKVQIFGVCFGGYSSLAPIVLNFIQQYDSSYYTVIANTYNQLQDITLAPVSTKSVAFTYTQDWSEEIAIDSLRQWTSITHKVYDHLSLNKHIYYQKADKHTVDVTIFAAKMIAQDFARPDMRDKKYDNLGENLMRKLGLSTYIRSKNIGLVYKYKDSCWATNTKEIIKELPIDERIVIWAHNNHIGRIITPNETKRLGYYLGMEFGNQYYPVGHIFYKGVFQALDENGYSKQFHTHLHITPLRKFFLQLYRQNHLL